MKLLITGRQMGKTTRAIEWAKQNDGLLVVPTQREADLIVREFALLPQHQVVPVRKLPLINRGPVAIDNLDELLAQMLGNVGYATMNRPEQIYLYGPTD